MSDLVTGILTSTDWHGDLVAGNGAVKTFRQAESIAYCCRIVFCNGKILHLQCGLSSEQHFGTLNERAGILINTVFFFPLFSLAFKRLIEDCSNICSSKVGRVLCLFICTTFIG